MRALACLLLAILAVGLPGCDQDVYEIELTPRGPVIERKLTVWHGGYQTDDAGQTKRRVASAIDPEKLSKLADIYGQEPTKVAENVHSFVGTFSEETPDDVGGAGNYTYLPSTMGSATFYIERFGGSDDLVAGLETGFRAADMLADIFAGWLESQFGDRAQFPKLRQFVDTEFRADLKNLSVYWWTIHNQPSGVRANEQGPDENVELIIRVVQYFAERDYIKHTQMKLLINVITEGGVGRSDQLSQLLPGILRDKIGLTDEELISDVAGLLGSPEAGESLGTYLIESGEADKLVAELTYLTGQLDAEASAQLTIESQEQALDTLKLLVTLQLYHMGSGVFEGVIIRLSLAVPAKPEMTNGKWDDQADAVSWPVKSLPDNPANWPVLYYANWAEPDEQFQTTHFGKVVLADITLYEYCLWQANLDEQKAAQWDAFLESLQPGESLTSRLQAFRFEGEPTTAPAEEGAEPPKPYELSAAKDQIERILSALAKEPETQPAIAPAE